MAIELALAGISPLDPSRIANGGASAASAAPQTGEASFAEALKGITSNAVADLRGAEEMSLKALSGDADIRDVTDAVMSAEQSLNTAIAIRDKIVTAFLEISRMQI
jgi:flagellar hook-basal body complex protein FliE